MKCPHCNHPLTEAEIKTLRGQLSASKNTTKRRGFALLSPERRREIAAKAAAKRWGKDK